VGANRVNEEGVPNADAVREYNAFSVEIRTKIDSLLNHVLLLSAGIQAITIGAFLSSTPPQFSAETVELLKFGWLSLSLSIVLCLLFMLSQAFAMINLGFRIKSKLEQSRPGAEILWASKPLRVLTWVVGLSAFASCGAGTVALSMAAVALIGSPVSA
jgi:hypothetical protein